METGTATIGALEIRANRFDLLNRIADDLAHEIKNPLHSMVINLELIRRRVYTGGAEDVLVRVDVIESEVVRINRLVESIFQLLRPGRDPSTWADVAGVLVDLEPVFAALAKASRVRIEVRPPRDGCVVPLGRDPLRHALLNLVVNALDALGNGPGDYLGVEALEADDEVTLQVIDTGHGIAPEEIGRIGVAGVSNRPGRAGLGIAVARALVEEAGGRIEIESVPGQGTRSALTLPRGSAC